MFWDMKKKLLGKFGIFLVFVYGLLPWVISVILSGKTKGREFNFFSFGAYTLILVVLFVVFNREKIKLYVEYLKIRQRGLWFLLSVLFLGFYIFGHIYFVLHKYYFPLIYLILGLVYLLGIGCVAVIFFGWRIFKECYHSLFVFFTIMLFFYSVTQLLWQLWDILARGVAKLTYLLLRIFYENVTLSFGATGDPKLMLEHFSVIIGPACSGIESLSMFLGLFVLLYVYEGKSLYLLRAGIVLIFGLLCTYLLNVIRISLIMVIGVKYPDAALGIFHAQAGWILFSVFLLVLLYFSYGWMRKPKYNHPLNLKK